MGKKAQNPEGGNVEAGALAEVANEPGQARYKTDPEAIPEAIAVDEQPMESRSSSKNLNKAHSKGSKRDAPVPQAVRMDSTIPLAQPYEGGGYGNQPTAIPQHMVQTACQSCDRVSMVPLMPNGTVYYTCPYCQGVNAGHPQHKDGSGGGALAAAASAGLCLLCCVDF
mmetsp:Transcript_35719/g.84004  ORF Transcript_35719/g.84004 Transcript_35719/m.84004 type:complete len:168 (+) Transcript_35719:147-650(+)